MIANREVLESAAKSLPTAPPSERDLEIFAATRIDCRRQVEVAAEFGISQSRVSQICRNVKLWRAGMGAEADLEGRDRKVVEGWLDAQRLEWLYEHTLDNYRRSCLPKRRERKGSNQHGEWHDETIDHPPGNLQCLRLAARLLELRWKMEEKCPQPSPHALALADESTFINRLISMRIWAEHRGEVPRGEEPGRLVERLLNELLGRAEKHPAAASQGSRTYQSSGSVDMQTTRILANSATTTEVGAAGPAGAHTANNISAAGAQYEPAGDADSDAVTACQDATCVEGTAGQASSGTQREEEGNRAADMTGEVTAGPASRGTATATTGRSDAEEERLALAELRRTLSTDIDPSWADYMVPNLLAEGQTNLALQGFTREQRQALLGWQRVMDLRGQKTGARRQEPEDRRPKPETGGANVPDRKPRTCEVLAGHP